MDFELRDIYTAFGMESSFGNDPVTKSHFERTGIKRNDAWERKYRGPFQISKEVQKKHGLSDQGVFDANKSALVYINETNDLLRNDESWAAWDVDQRAKDLGLDRGLLRYLVWQQGRAGAIDIITAATHGNDSIYSTTIHNGKAAGETSGNLGSAVRRNMANNVKGLNPSDNGVKYANEYLAKLREKWEERREESYSKFPASPIEAVMGKGGKF